MGLDVGFYFYGDETEIAYLRKHDAISTIFFNYGTNYVYEEYTDFWVDFDMLHLVEAELRKHAPIVASDLRPALSASRDREILARSDEDVPWEVLYPIYLRLIDHLRRTIEESGQDIVCAWSA